MLIKPFNHQPVLIVGGAGYIGSHMVNYLQQAGIVPVVLDNLSTGHRDAVRDCEFICGDIHDTKLLEHLFSIYSFAAVFHFASFIQVGESVQEPGKYYQNNVVGTLNLLQTMLKSGVKYFVFSSTAAVYGEPQYTPINEAHPLLPINPYGKSKWMVEQMLPDFAKSDGLQYAILRYFNAAGANPAARLSERHDPETHLIPLILQVAKGIKSSIKVYGQDYPTSDGTCIRDYVHVDDLCSAHLLALYALKEGKSSCIYNLGGGTGYSVQQVIEVVRKVTKQTIPLEFSQRRPGDPAVLVADAACAIKELGWRPQYSDIETIITHAWQSFA